MTSDISVPGDRQDPESTSDISSASGVDAEPGSVPVSRATPVPERFADIFSRYESLVTKPGCPLDPDSRRAYLSRVRQFLAWLEDVDTDDVGGDPLADEAAHDAAVRDYRTYLLTVRKAKPSTVNNHFDAINDFYARLFNMRRADVKRQRIPKTAPRALPAKRLTRFLRAAERATVRDRTLAFVELYAGLRGGEVVALDVEDIPMSARKGTVLVRHGKGASYRKVPMHSKLREALEEWLSERCYWPRAGEEPALFLNARGGRLSERSVYDAITAIAEDAGLEVGRDAEFTPHTLRHQAGTEMIRAGFDPVVVADLMGHSMEMVRRYSMPTEDDKAAAIGSIPVDE